MNNYRITSNGLKYRVEQHGRLWFNKTEWRPVPFSNGFCLYHKEYDSLSDAQDALNHIIEHDAAESRGWQPVTTGAPNR
jgi:hypothetical protein